MPIADKIKALRKEKRLTQVQLAEAINVERSSVAKYESGVTPSMDVLVRIADFFNVTTDYLLGNTDIKKENSPTEMSAEEQEIIELWKGLSTEKREAFKSLLGLKK